MLNSNNEALLKQVNKNQTLLIQKLQDDIELLNEEIEASNQQIDTLKSQHHISLSQQQSIIEDLRSECQNYQQQNMELQSKFTQSVLQNQLLQSKYDKKNKQYKDQIVELKQQIKLSHLKNQDYQRDILELRKSLDNNKLEICKLIDNSTLLNEQNKQLKANLDLQQVDYENKIEQYQNLIQDKDEEITLIINENGVLNRNLEQMEKSANLSESLHSQIDTLQKQNQNLLIQLSDLQNHNTLLRQQLQLQSSEIQVSSSSLQLQLQSAPQQQTQDAMNRNVQQEMVVLQKDSDIQALQQTTEVQNVQLTQSQSFNNDLQLSYQQETQNTEKDYNQNQINTLKQQIAKLTSDLKECELKHVQVKQVQESTISKLNHDVRLLEQKNEDLILHNNKLINEIKQNELIQQKESTIICQKISEFEIQLLESHHQIEDLNQEKQKQERVVEKLNLQMQASKQIQSKLEEDITKYQNFLISHHKQLEAVTSNESSDSSDSSEETITEKPQQLNFDALCTKLTEQIRLVQLRLEIYEKQIKQYKQELHSKTVEIQKLFSENSDSNLKVQRLSQLQPKFDNQEAIIKQKDLTIENLSQQITKQQAQLHENENKLQQLQIDKETLNRKNVELSNQIQIHHTIKNDLQISSNKEDPIQHIELMSSEQTSTSIFDQTFSNINYQILLFTEENTTQIKSILSNKIDNLENNLLRTINKYQKLQEIIQKNYHNIQNLYEQSQQNLIQKENLYQIENQKQQMQRQTLLEEVHQQTILISQLENQQQILSLQLKNLNQQNQDQKQVITQLQQLDEKQKIDDLQMGSNQTKLEELQQRTINQEADLKKASEQNTQLEIQVKDLNNQVQSKLNTINELRQELDSLKNNQTGSQFDSIKLQQQQKQILELISNNTNLNQQSQDAQLRLREMEALNLELQDRVNQLSKQGVSQKETINQLQQQNQMEVKQNLTFLQQMDPLQKQIDHLTRENRKLQQSNNDFEKAYGKLPTYGSPRKVQNQDQNQIKKLEDEILQIQYKFQQEIQEKNIELNNIQKQYEQQLEEVRELKLDEISKLEQNCVILSNQLKQQQVVNNELLQNNSQIERDNSQLSEEIEKLKKQQKLQSQNQESLKQQDQINHECKYIELNQTIGNLQIIINDQNLQLLNFKNHTLDLEEQIKHFEVQIQNLIKEKEELCQIKDSNKSDETFTKNQQNEELDSQNQLMEQLKNEQFILDQVNQDKLKLQQQQIEQGQLIHQQQQVIECQQVEIKRLTLIESGSVEQKKESDQNISKLQSNQAEQLLPVQQEEFQVELKQKQKQIEAKDIEIHELKQKLYQNLQLNNELEQQLKDKQAISIALENEIKQLQNVNQTQLQKITELNQDFQRSFEQVEEQKQTLTNQSEQNALLESKCNQMQQNVMKIQTQNNSLIQINQQLESTLEQQQHVNAQIIQKQEQSFQIQLDKLNIQLEDQQNQLKLLQQENGEYKQEIEKIMNDQKQWEQNKLNELVQVKKESQGQIQKLMDQISRAEGLNVEHQNEILEMDNVIKKLIQEKDKNINNDMIEQLQIKIKMNEEQIGRLLMTNKALMEENAHLQEQIKDDLNSSFCSNASQNCATKNQENEVSLPSNPRLQRAYQQYSQIIEITHPLNVNQKYNSYFTLIPDQFIGTGIKKTNQYESRLSKEEWQQKRVEFWDSRIEGQKENWATIRAALEADEGTCYSKLGTAKTLLQAADLKLIKNSMQIVFDNHGQKYDLPVFVMHNPVSFPQKQSFDQNLYSSFDRKIVKFKVRSTKWNIDKELSYNTGDKVELLIKELQSKEEPQKMKLFVNGREMKGHNMFGNYGVQDNSVIIQSILFQVVQAFMF
ncbi:unnamed protein product (macronuclear) [Paramecium tetraurelia]|uniref:DC-UbP/UBTD2 N-terminal domain-containing protein n=1 Tax=Paramecium tetraurelia TaxID=5888 RepID=A0CFL4_PARTE|nr:uncharacterized protein GSPATT00038021001 [Paramecium tetraurelia]CAK69581.1 unnamed protein product [Paramecium tetraurelia]|eukprot:XP_001436978.1 hypothetical protein (macronuclear) [Paramecium tetraurelia strain d4-2]